MKDCVEKFIVLQNIQTAPSRLQPASARCFLAAMILPSAPIRDLRACATRYIVYRQAWTSEFRRDRNTKYAIVTRRPIHSYAKLYSYYLKESITTVLLNVIPHNCSEMHRNVAIPDYPSLVTQTSGMDICQIGYDICEFDSLRGLGIDIIGSVHFDNRDRFAIWIGSIGKVTEPCQQTSGCWHLTFDSFLNLDMGDDMNTKFLLLRVQTTYIRKWEVIVGGHDWSCWDLWI